MSSKKQSEMHESALVASPTIVEVESLTDRIKSIYDSIAERANELLRGHGREGRDLDDWLHAERELLHPMSVEMLESADDIIVHADVPGFKAKDIKVSVEPSRLTITGMREESAERSAGERVYTERSASEIFRSLGLPAAVEPGKATATLTDGVLTLTLTKAAHAKPVDGDAEQS